MVNAAVFDCRVTAKDPDAIAGCVADFAVAQRHVVGTDLDTVSTSPVAVDKIVFVDAWLGDFQSLDALRIPAASDLAASADRIFRLSSVGNDDQQE